jgi:hypothetical protein
MKTTQDSETKLEPESRSVDQPCSRCPFCGYEDPEILQCLSGKYRVYCGCCLAAGPNCSSESEAAAKWNFRSEKSDLIMMELRLRDYAALEEGWRAAKGEESEDLRIAAARMRKSILANTLLSETQQKQADAND